jgi:hypothetical protein
MWPATDSISVMSPQSKYFERRVDRYLDEREECTLLLGSKHFFRIAPRHDDKMKQYPEICRLFQSTDDFGGRENKAIYMKDEKEKPSQYAQLLADGLGRI